MNYKVGFFKFLLIAAAMSCGRQEVPQYRYSEFTNLDAQGTTGGKRLYVVTAPKASLYSEPKASSTEVAQLDKGSLVIFSNTNGEDWMQVESTANASAIGSIEPVWVHESQMQCANATLCLITSTSGAANGRAKADKNSNVVRTFATGGVVRIDDKSGPWLEVIGFAEPTALGAQSGWLERPVATQGSAQIGVVKTSAGVAGVRPQANMDIPAGEVLNNGDIVVYRNSTQKGWVRVERTIDKGELPAVGPLWVHNSMLDCGPEKLCFISSADGSANGRASASRNANVVQVLKSGGLVKTNQTSGDWVEVVAYSEPGAGDKISGWMPREFLILETRLEGDAVKLDVPYYPQLANANEPYSTCGITSASMLLGYYNQGLRADDLYRRYGKRAGQSPGGLAGIYEKVMGSGTKTFSTYNGSFEDIKNYLRRGQPVVTHGYFTRSGHIVLIVGFNKEGFIVHDPYGKWLGNHKYDTSASGRYLTYSYARMRQAMGQDGAVWFSTAGKPGGGQQIASN